MSDMDILYKLTAYFRGKALEISVFEYEITHETTKSYMTKTLSGAWKNEKVAFPKDNEGKVEIDQFAGSFHRATLFLTEVSREDVETQGVNQLKAGVRRWCQDRLDYVTRKITAIDEFIYEPKSKE